MPIIKKPLPYNSEEEIFFLAQITEAMQAQARAFVNSISQDAEILRDGDVKKIDPGVLIPMWNNQGFAWKADTQQYIAINNRPVAVDVVKATSEIALRQVQYQLLQQALDLKDGKLPPEQWFENGKTLIIDGHMAEVALGSGGWQNTPQSAWDKLSTDKERGLPYHLGRWNEFGKDVSDGRYGKDVESGAFMQRVSAYASAMRATFENRKLQSGREAGHTEARRIRGDVDSCSDCIDWELLGWMDIDEMESDYPIGASSCGSNCHCVIITRREGQRFVTDDDLDEKIAAAEGG